MMPARLNPSGGRVLVVECRARSHARRKVAAIAAFQEQVNAAGTRVGIELCDVERITSDGTRLIKFPYAQGGTMMRDPRPHPTTETQIYVDNDQPLESVWGDPPRNDRDHHQFRCPLCPRNESTRYEKLYPVLEQLFDGGVLRIDLARFAAIVDMLH